MGVLADWLPYWGKKGQVSSWPLASFDISYLGKKLHYGGRISHRRASDRHVLYLTGVHLTGMHLISICLMGVHLMGASLISVCHSSQSQNFMGMHLMRAGPPRHQA